MVCFLTFSSFLFFDIFLVSSLSNVKIKYKADYKIFNFILHLKHGESENVNFNQKCIFADNG